MTYTQSRFRKPILQAAIACFALLVFSGIFHVIADQECRFLHNAIWASLQLLRPAVLAAMTSAPAHPCPASALLEHLLQIVAANWPLPQVLVG